MNRNRNSNSNITPERIVIAVLAVALLAVLLVHFGERRITPDPIETRTASTAPGESRYCRSKRLAEQASRDFLEFAVGSDFDLAELEELVAALGKLGQNADAICAMPRIPATPENCKSISEWTVLVGVLAAMTIDSFPDEVTIGFGMSAKAGADAHADICPPAR